MELKYGDRYYIEVPLKDWAKKYGPDYIGYEVILVKRNDKPDLELGILKYNKDKDKYYRTEIEDCKAIRYLEREPPKLHLDAEYIIEMERYKLCKKYHYHFKGI